MTKEQKEKIEKKYLAEIRKLEPYSNPRNFASGSLKLVPSTTSTCWGCALPSESSLS